MPHFRRRYVALIVFSVACSATCFRSAMAERPHDSRLMLTGVSLAGGEFGCQRDTFSNQHPGEFGKDYTFPRSETVRHFARAGFQLLRIPFRWERLQPKLGGELDRHYLREITEVVRAAERHDVFLILDLHNYGRYRLWDDGVVRELVIDERVGSRVPVTRDHFRDVWKRIALEFRHHPAIVGYGLMNEPHDMGDSDWKEISQLAVDTIRRIDRETAIVVSGDDWSSAERFVTANGNQPWIRDPANHIVYEAHCYFDHDGSGKYARSYAAELRVDADLDNRGVRRVEPFLQWCREHQVRGLIGEYGTPRDASWREVTKRFLQACEASQVGVCYWAAGEWWGDYPLSIQPRETSFGTPPQLRWLQQTTSMRRHPSR